MYSVNALIINTVYNPNLETVTHVYTIRWFCEVDRCSGGQDAGGGNRALRNVDYMLTDKISFF